MKPIKARVTKSIPHRGSFTAADNSGARIVRLISVKGHKTVRGRIPAAGVGDLVRVVVVDGRPDMRKQVVPAVVVRQKQVYRRIDGMRIKFEDNAVVVLKDDLGNPKGTMIKGPIAKEASDRWSPLSKIAKMIV